MPLSEREKFIILVDNDSIKKSDVIVLLEGDGVNRVKKTAALYLEGWANRILFSGGIKDLSYGSYPAEYVVPALIKMDVPEESILIDEKSQHTKDQAENVVTLALENKWKKIILVASHYHQYRAYLTFLKIILENNYKIELINAPVNDLLWFEKLDWGIRFDLLDSEFERIKKYAAQGDLATFEQAIEYQKWKEQQV
jgi:uncharacterized SAM-binding protein YcdF (DUF218 family)